MWHFDLRQLFWVAWVLGNGPVREEEDSVILSQSLTTSATQKLHDFQFFPNLTIGISTSSLVGHTLNL